MTRQSRLITITLMLMILATSNTYSFSLKTILEWCPRRLSKEFWGVRVRMLIVKDVKTDLSAFNALQVMPFENELGELAPPALCERLTGSIVQAIEKLKLFSTVDTANPSQRKPGLYGRHTKTLIVKGSLVDYYEGHRILRLLEGGLDKGTVAILIQLIDDQTGMELGRTSIAGDLVSSSWGSTERTVPKSIGKKVARLIKAHYGSHHPVQLQARLDSK